VNSSDSLSEIQARRKDLLRAAFDSFAPDILLIELFPFGRKKFNFELLPLLAHARATRPATKIVCSLRDIGAEARSSALRGGSLRVDESILRPVVDSRRPAVAAAGRNIWECGRP